MPLDEGARMSARFLFMAFGLSLIVAPLKAGAVEVSGPARIIDGDTLVIGETTIRLHGIDAAETGQRCAGEGHKILKGFDELKCGHEI